MDVNEARKALKCHSCALYGKSIMDAAKRAYFSGDTRAVYPDQIPAFIDGREDKNNSWMRI